MTNRQDWMVCELSQSGISSRGYTPGPYSNREDLLLAFDQMIVRLHGGGDSGDVSVPGARQYGMTGSLS